MINLLKLSHCGAQLEKMADVCIELLFRDVFFLLLLSCSLTSDEVTKLYWKGGAEANESTDIVFLSKEVSSLRILQQN